MMKIKINGTGGNIEIVNGNYSNYMRIVFLNTSGTVRNMVPNVTIEAEFTEEDIEEKRTKVFSFNNRGELFCRPNDERYKLFVREDEKYITLNLLKIGLMGNRFLVLAVMFDKKTTKSSFLKIVNPERTQDDIDHERFMNCIGGSSLRRFIHDGMPVIIRQEMVDDIVCNVFTYNGMALYFPGRLDSDDFELYRPYGTFFVVPSDDINVERDAQFFLADKMPDVKQKVYDSMFLPTGTIKVGHIISTEHIPAEGYHVYLSKGEHNAEFVFSREEHRLCVAFVGMLRSLKITTELVGYFNAILAGDDDQCKELKAKKLAIPEWVKFGYGEIKVDIKYFEALQWREAELVVE